LRGGYEGSNPAPSCAEYALAGLSSGQEPGVSARISRLRFSARSAESRKAPANIAPTRSSISVGYIPRDQPISASATTWGCRGKTSFSSTCAQRLEYPALKPCLLASTQKAS